MSTSIIPLIDAWNNVTNVCANIQLNRQQWQILESSLARLQDELRPKLEVEALKGKKK